MKCALAVGLCAWVAVAAAGAAAPAEAATFTGLVKSATGASVIVRAGQDIPVTIGTRVEKGDTIRTGAGAAIGMVFSDDTLVSLGPTTELVIDDYLFDPLEKQLSFVARVLRGTVSYISGQIAKLAPKSVRLVAPAATIAVRGTHVLISVPQ